MRLFHCSNEKHSILAPHFGARRHGGEGAGAIDKAVIWLSNDSESVASDAGQVIRFRHEVEVQDNDPDLVIDEEFAQMMQQAERMYSKPIPLRWYTYSKPLEVISVAEYSAASKKYVPDLAAEAMTEQDKVDTLGQITAGYAMLTGGYDAKRNAYVWNCGNRAAGEALSGKLCASLDGYHLGVTNPDGGTAFTFDGPNGERLVLSLDAIFDKSA